jgi:hypothetical protein
MPFPNSRWSDRNQLCARLGVIVARHVGDVGHQGLNCDGSVSPAGYSVFRGAERAVGQVWQRLVDDGGDRLGRVDRKEVAPARAIEVRVAEPVSPAHGRTISDRPGKTDPRSEIVSIGIDERALRYRTIRRANHGPRDGIVVRQDVVPFPVWRRIFIAQAEVERQPIGDPPVVLRVEMRCRRFDGEAAERILSPQAEHEVREVVGAPRSPGGSRERSVVVSRRRRVDVLTSVSMR